MPARPSSDTSADRGQHDFILALARVRALSAAACTVCGLLQTVLAVIPAYHPIYQHVPAVGTSDPYLRGLRGHHP